MPSRLGRQGRVSLYNQRGRDIPNQTHPPPASPSTILSHSIPPYPIPSYPIPAPIPFCPIPSPDPDPSALLPTYKYPYPHPAPMPPKRTPAPPLAWCPGCRVYFVITSDDLTCPRCHMPTAAARCTRCQYEWVPDILAMDRPRYCPQCHSPYYNRTPVRPNSKRVRR